ncbi:protein of unknown function [Chitinophaga sp. CF118]|uniref:DUF3298 and DUF4163 domain-containing protein n=1 Tax=Chitinophaga sp. CF118 TaxID=1884367 RepID=UPI0008F36F49|nr:DUF3298 and DUF4163 domain-containing protein [Chitinophaga sp. CF118]SFE71467.1 protein of unknown function [Chitinophaga sp. CF118]
MRTLLFAITCCILVSCGRQTRHSTSVTVPNLTTTPYFYVHLTGTIGDQPVTMDLVKSGPWMYKGYYMYDKIGEPILIWGSPDNSKRIVLNENTDRNEERFFTGQLDSAGTFKGVWRGKGTSYPFTLKANFDGAIALDVYYAADSLKLFPNHPASPTGEASNSIVWPSAEVTDEPTADFIRKSITGGKSVNNVHQFIKRDIDSFLLTYKTAAVDMDTTEGIPLTSNWAADADMKVVWNHYPLLSLEYFSYEYTGGAHGNYGANYMVLDLEKKKILTLDDIFKPEYKTVLIPELEKSFRKAFKVEEDESIEGMLLQKEIKPNNNFYLTDKGVVFSYTPYEIGPYALGQVSLFIPFKDIKPVLK